MFGFGSGSMSLLFVQILPGRAPAIRHAVCIVTCLVLTPTCSYDRPNVLYVYSFTRLIKCPGLLAAKHDPKEDRSAPPPPTVPSFPVLDAFAGLDSSALREDIRETVLRVKRPSDLSKDIFADFGIRLSAGLDLDALTEPLPSWRFHMPPKDWLDLTKDPPTLGATAPAATTRVLANGRPAPGQRDFDIRARELALENQDALSALTRLRHDGKKAPRLAHFRRFWEGLDNMAYYWDTSLDEYFPSVSADNMDIDAPLSIQTGAEEPRKRIKSDAGLSTVPQPENNSTLGYRGNRINTGSEMPEYHRGDTVRSFVEPVAWCFGLSLNPHRRAPLLAVGNVRLPVRMSCAAWRPPNDRMQARAGWLAGPAFGIQCRPYMKFDPTKEHQAAFDLLQELQGLLYIAQERAREGLIESKPGQGQWYTEKVRWGGGPGGEVGEGRGNVDDEPAQPEKPDESRPRPRASAKEKRKASALELWKVVKPGNGFWDPKVQYEAIGKDKDSAWDTVRMCLFRGGKGYTGS